MYAIFRGSFSGSAESLTRLNELLGGAVIELIDGEMPALTFSSVDAAKSWVAKMSIFFNTGNGMAVGSLEDPLVKEFPNFVVNFYLFNVLCAVADGRCNYIKADRQWEMKGMDSEKSEQIGSTLDLLASAL